MLTHEEFEARAFERPGVKAEYDRLEEEFAILDEILKKRAERRAKRKRDLPRGEEIRNTADPKDRRP